MEDQVSLNVTLRISTHELPYNPECLRSVIPRQCSFVPINGVESTKDVDRFEAASRRNFVPGFSMPILVYSTVEIVEISTRLTGSRYIQ